MGMVVIASMAAVACGTRAVEAVCAPRIPASVRADLGMTGRGRTSQSCRRPEQGCEGARKTRAKGVHRQWVGPGENEL
jgi:hypothetical protein